MTYKHGRIKTQNEKCPNSSVRVVGPRLSAAIQTDPLQNMNASVLKERRNMVWLIQIQNAKLTCQDRLFHCNLTSATLSDHVQVQLDDQFCCLESDEINVHVPRDPRVDPVLQRDAQIPSNLC